MSDSGELRSPSKRRLSVESNSSAASALWSVASPSISSLGPDECETDGAPVPKIAASTPFRRSLKEQFFGEENLSSDLSSVQFDETSSDDDDDELGVVSKIKKIKLTKKDIYFKPKRKNTLYNQMFENCENIYALAQTWIASVFHSEKDAVKYFLQFIIDLIGDQNYQVKDNLLDNFDKIRTDLEAAENTIHKKFICLFNSTSKNAQNVQNITFTLLEYIVKESHRTNILYKTNVMQKCLEFIQLLSKSNKCLIRLTAVIIASKLCTYFLWLAKRLNRRSTGTGKISQEKIRTIFNIIEVLYFIFQRNCCISVTDLHPLRKFCALEIDTYVKLMPNFILHDRNGLLLVKRLIVDPNKYVRAAALSTCTSILSNQQNQRFIKPEDTASVLDTVLKRLRDVDYKIVALAINCLTDTFDIYPDVTTGPNRLFIMKQMFARDFDLAVASGKFLLKCYWKEDDEMLKQILIINSCIKGQLSLLTETIFACRLDIFNVPRMVKILLSNNDQFTYNQEVELIEILYHLVCLLTKGKCDGTLTKAKSFDFTTSNILIGQELLPNYERLLIKYGTDDVCLLWFTKILLALDLTVQDFKKFRTIFNGILNHFGDYFGKSFNVNVLTNISHLFQRLSLSEFLKPICIARLNIIVNDLMQNYNLISQHEIPIEDLSDEQYYTLKQSLYSLRALFEFHNLTNVLNWRYIYYKWENLQLRNEIIENQIKICEYYLKWKLDDLLEIKNKDEAIDEANVLKQQIDCFLDSALKVLNSKEGLEFTTFQSIYNVLMKYVSNENNMKIKKLSEYMEFILNDTEIGIIRNFVLNTCVKGNDNEIERNCLIYYINLVLNCWFIGKQELLQVIKYYATWITYKDIFDNIFTNLLMKDKACVVLVMIATLGNNFLKRIKNIDNMKLSLEFARFLPKDLLSLAVAKGITFASVKSIYFLPLLQPFTVNLRIEDRKSMLNLLKRNFTASDLQNDCSVQFIQALKSKYIKNVWVSQIDSDSDSITYNHTDSAAFNSTSSVTNPSLSSALCSSRISEKGAKTSIPQSSKLSISSKLIMSKNLSTIIEHDLDVNTDDDNIIEEVDSDLERESISA